MKVKERELFLPAASRLHYMYGIKLALLLSCYMMEGMKKMKSYVCSPLRKDKSV